MNNCETHNWTKTAMVVFHPQPDEPMPVATTCENDMVDTHNNEGLHLQMCVGCGLIRFDPSDRKVRCLMFPHPEHEDPTAVKDANTQ